MVTGDRPQATDHVNEVVVSTDTNIYPQIFFGVGNSAYRTCSGFLAKEVTDEHDNKKAEQGCRYAAVKGPVTVSINN